MCHFYCYKLWQKKVLKAINLRAQYMDNRTRRLENHIQSNPAVHPAGAASRGKPQKRHWQNRSGYVPLYCRQSIVRSSN